VTEAGKPKWRRFEELVATIQKALSPEAVVTPNDEIVGRITGVPRQIDISVRQKAGQFELLIVIDCKDYARPVDVKDVEEFMGMVQDVAANKGAMVAPLGFSAAAKTRAEKAGIDLFRPVDTGGHEWKIYAALPALCEFTELAKFSVAFSWTGRGAIPTVTKPRDIVLYDSAANPLGTIGALLQKRWREGTLPRDPGTSDLPVTDCATKVKVGDEFFDLNVRASIIVTRKTYLGSIPLKEISGLRNELTGSTLATQFLTGFITPQHVEETWKLIPDPSELAVKPAFRLRAILTFDLGAQSVAFRVQAKEPFNVEVETRPVDSDIPGT
jgi:Restriction endonuclease